MINYASVHLTINAIVKDTPFLIKLLAQIEHLQIGISGSGLPLSQKTGRL